MNFKLDFTGNEVNIVLSALSKQPYDQVAQLIEKVIAEVRKQSEVKETPTEGK
jgi:hypothetical protein